jgi:hypothetical protein
MARAPRWSRLKVSQTTSHFSHTKASDTMPSNDRPSWCFHCNSEPSRHVGWYREWYWMEGECLERHSGSKLPRNEWGRSLHACSREILRCCVAFLFDSFLTLLLLLYWFSIHSDVEAYYCHRGPLMEALSVAGTFGSDAWLMIACRSFVVARGAINDDMKRSKVRFGFSTVPILFLFMNSCWLISLGSVLSLSILFFSWNPQWRLRFRVVHSSYMAFIAILILIIGLFFSRLLL